MLHNNAFHVGKSVWLVSGMHLTLTRTAL